MNMSEFTAQLEAHHRSSYCWALACCQRDPVEAEEVVQTVYLKILEGKALFRGESSLRTWLFALIRTTAADRRRRGVLQRLRWSRLAELSAAPPRAERIEDVLSRSEARDAFRRALGALPRRQREALELVFYHDLSVEEAATVMGVTVGSARTHYDRGKKRLRQVLEESEVSYVSEWGTRENPGEVS
jgi:RNA polymerase sigma-70 factor (ECF subfamily)